VASQALNILVREVATDAVEAFGICAREICKGCKSWHAP
jgi:hypothetical protein